ncbi:uncharacterized protein SCHCODRAFT_02612919 [Schizophyllum commune H4-8]|uniref:uncharacterized protein n=1 Tax=Schizophyllum commune (strain H4-8 / FGSC 9210) TaxID=578458 RepID=UPI00215E9D36|nr:uncharacterized protein SCHCODRAFT_02612919 [Schizophyllum commune H4-8]KAI5898703.1 hypothetical protein SCHCODRAFT_02612919 [Schizophyllum commune H4-8]
MSAAQTRGITTIPSISLNTTQLYLSLQRYIPSHLITQSLHTILRGTPPRARSRHQQVCMQRAPFRRPYYELTKSSGMFAPCHHPALKRITTSDEDCSLIRHPATLAQDISPRPRRGC